LRIDGKLTRTIWPLPEGGSVGVIDQRRLPHHVGH
jgi:hypothetical protein